MKFLSLLTVLFIGLKLTGHIDWNWFLVLLPILLGPIVLIVVLILVGILGLIARDYEKMHKK
jgi:ABC-type polysaccharide/polyol phosphate export permease